VAANSRRCLYPIDLGTGRCYCRLDPRIRECPSSATRSTPAGTSFPRPLPGSMQSLLLSALVSAAYCMAAGAVATTIPIDFSAVSRRFDGIGALSGGGGVTRLLVDYKDDDIRSDVLDALFKPMGGASLHWLKGGVDVGSILAVRCTNRFQLRLKSNIESNRLCYLFSAVEIGGDTDSTEGSGKANMEARATVKLVHCNCNNRHDVTSTNPYARRRTVAYAHS